MIKLIYVWFFLILNLFFACFNKEGPFIEETLSENKDPIEIMTSELDEENSEENSEENLPDSDDVNLNSNLSKTIYQISPNITLFFTYPGQDSEMLDFFLDLISRQNTDSFLDFCFYGLSHEKVLLALEEAIARGVHLRLVGNRDKQKKLSDQTGLYYSAYYRLAFALDQAFPVDGKKRINFPKDQGFADFNLVNEEGSMHNKFAIFTDQEGKEYLFTGSTNCTESGFTLNNNNSLLISDQAMVATYRNQFKFLLGEVDLNPPQDLINHQVDGVLFEVFFSPHIQAGRSALEHLITKIDQVQESIYFMIFSFTHQDLASTLIKKNKEGLIVKGIFDKSQLDNSSEELFAHQGIPWRVDGNEKNKNDYGGKLHHKTMILDHGEESATVITGSFNWSYLANSINNENLIFIHSKKIAQIYLNEWQMRWEEAEEEEIQTGDEADYQNIIINEVMWMGSRRESDLTLAQDEFIELKNMTSKRINLNCWLIEKAAPNGKPLVLNNYIEPNSYLVILGNSKAESAFSPSQFIVNSDLSISNNKIELVLKDVRGEVIDYAGDGSSGNDLAGENGSGSGSLKKSMARLLDWGDGRLAENWFTTKNQANISLLYSYPLYNFATPGVENDWSDNNYQALDLIISEVCWSGTNASSTNEWLELYNNTEQDINLAGWSLIGDDDGQPIDIALAGIILAKGHFLLERTDDDSVKDVEADFFFKGGFNNKGENLTLYYGSDEIDKIKMSEANQGWAAGSSQPKLSMVRIDYSQAGESSNWQNGLGDEEGAGQK